MRGSKFGAVLALSIGAIAATPITAAEAGWDYRPENFYSTIVSRDDHVCAAIVGMLNQLNKRPQEETGGYANPSFIGDLWLRTDSQIEWEQRIPFDVTRGRLSKSDFGSSALDFASLDIANDGKAVPVLRWSFTDSIGYHSVLHLPAHMSADWDARPLETLKEVAKDVLRISFGSSDRQVVRNFPVDYALAFDLVRVEGKLFLLAANGQELARVMWADNAGLDVFVLEFNSSQNIVPICQYRGGNKHQ
jgi:hypothetical protein